jgi:hypothetical protein
MTDNIKTKQTKIDRKAWIRILEAFLGILLISGVLFFVLARQTPQTDLSQSVYETQRQILNIISNNQSLRNAVLDENYVVINNSIQRMIPGTWGFYTQICDLNNICSDLPYQNKNVYSTEVVISSSLTSYNPKKLVFFVWMKN